MLARIVAFVIPLGFDTLAVAIALGLRGIEPLRPALVFAAFETITPIVGIVVGRQRYLRSVIGKAVCSFRFAVNSSRPRRRTTARRRATRKL